MKISDSTIDIIDQVITTARQKGIVHLHTTSDSFDGNVLEVNHKEVVNFGSCSYLGLEFDERIKYGAINAINNFGTQFSESRAYVGLGLYEKLENNLNRIFDAYTVVTPTTTLGHIGCIPVVIADKDAILLDHQVHNSVQTAVELLRGRNIKTELVRHNNIEILEEKIKQLRQKHPKVWYMADGVYSMYGDFAPVKELYRLMDIYPEFHVYMDDAHGMSCFGTHGRGYALSEVEKLHPQMILATSLNKAFASGGGVLVFPTKEQARKVRTCASTLITSGPMQPSGLGAAVASSEIHLSDEIYSMQEDLYENIKYANTILRKVKLPLVKNSNSPIFFIGVGLPKIGYNLISKMKESGFYVNLGVFPAVPLKNTGVRFTITRLHTFSQIEEMIVAMSEYLPKVLQEEDYTIEQIYKAFKMESPEELENKNTIIHSVNSRLLRIEHYTSIEQMNKDEWNSLLGDRGTYDYDGLKLLEKTFCNNDLPENNWLWDYFLIRNKAGYPVLATFLTTSLSKDDMLAPAPVSQNIEEIRKTDTYYLTSKLIMMGSPLTEGNHLYIDKNSVLWKEAMKMLFDNISTLQEKYDASYISLRDLDENDSEMDMFLLENGFIKTYMPENNVISSGLNWATKDEFIASLSSRSRRHVREDVLRYEHCYNVSIETNVDEETLQYYYKLYLNVKKRNFAINTFEVPFTFFKNISASPDWEMLTLRLNPEYDTRKIRMPIAVVFARKNNYTYNPLLVGIDYNYLEEFQCYRQSLYRVVMRANELKMNKINFGFGASVEKRKFGAIAKKPVAYLQAKDTYNMQLISSMYSLEAAK